MDSISIREVIKWCFVLFCFFPLEIGRSFSILLWCCWVSLAFTHMLLLFALAVIQLLCNVKHWNSFGGPIACPLSPIVTSSKLAKFI